VFDLDVDSPEKIVRVLQRASDAFHDSASELSASWQDKGAGRPWTVVAEELERASVKITQRLQKEYRR
jgi:phosphoglycolate phosphatase-like HAD superfamily hydrolase